MFFELREYRCQPGMRDKWIKFMEDVIIPFQSSKGMTIVGSFKGEEDDHYIWIRRFKNDKDKEKLYKAVYESDEWKTNISPKIPDMMDRTRIKVTRIEATGKSMIQ